MIASNFFVISRATTTPPAAAERVGEVGHGAGEPMRRLVDDEGERKSRDRGEQRSSRLRSGRQETEKGEALGRKPRGRNRGDRRIRTGDGDHRQARVADGGDEAGPRIAHCRRAGVAYERDALAGTKQGFDVRRAPRLVVRVQRKRARRDAVVTQQDRGYAGIFGSDDVCARKHVERTERHIAEVTERSRDHI